MKMKVKRAGYPLGMKGSAPVKAKRRAPVKKKAAKGKARKMTAKQLKYFGKRKKKK